MTCIQSDACTVCGYLALSFSLSKTVQSQGFAASGTLTLTPPDSYHINIGRAISNQTVREREMEVTTALLPHLVADSA